jgi:uncharacterized protein (UPF0335 family)
MQTDPNQTPPENDELDVTEIIERIEKLEKEISDQKEIKNRLTDCEESIDSIAQTVSDLSDDLARNGQS